MQCSSFGSSLALLLPCDAVEVTQSLMLANESILCYRCLGFLIGAFSVGLKCLYRFKTFLNDLQKERLEVIQDPGITTKS